MVPSSSLDTANTRLRSSLSGISTVAEYTKTLFPSTNKTGSASFFPGVSIRTRGSDHIVPSFESDPTIRIFGDFPPENVQTQRSFPLASRATEGIAFMRNASLSDCFTAPVSKTAARSKVARIDMILESVPQHELHDARKTRAGDHTELLGCFHVSPRATPLGVVKCVEHLPAKLERLAFADRRILGHLKSQLLIPALSRTFRPELPLSPRSHLEPAREKH